MITNKYLLELHEGLVKKHQDLIKKQGSVNPMIIMVHRDNKLSYMMLQFRNAEEKQLMKQRVKSFLVQHDIIGYFFFSDARMTLIKPGHPEKTKVQEALIHNLLTPKGNKFVFIIHDGKKILEVQRIPEEEMSHYGNDWDLWGKGVDEDLTDEVVKEYQNFKDEHPEDYKDVI